MNIIALLAERIPEAITNDCLSTIVDHLMRKMSELDGDNKNWTDSSEPVAYITESHSGYELALDRMAAAKLPGFWSTVSNKISPTNQLETWPFRCASLMAIACVSVECHEELKKDFRQLLLRISPALADEDDR